MNERGHEFDKKARRHVWEALEEARSRENDLTIL